MSPDRVEEMSPERREILEMVQKGKVTAEEATRLIEAIADAAETESRRFSRESGEGGVPESGAGVDLNQAILDGATLDGAVLDGARLQGANLQGVNL